MIAKEHGLKHGNFHNGWRPKKLELMDRQWLEAQMHQAAPLSSVAKNTAGTLGVFFGTSRMLGFTRNGTPQKHFSSKMKNFFLEHCFLTPLECRDEQTNYSLVVLRSSIKTKPVFLFNQNTTLPPPPPEN